MRRLIIILIVFAAFPVSAIAGLPVFTDDTGTLGPGKWEINVGVDIDRRHSETHYDAPALDINYGFGERIQLNYSTSWIVLDSRGEGIKNGLSNSEVAVKWRFLDEDRHGIAVSVYPRIVFNNPTSSADRGLVDKGTVYRLPVQVEKKIGIININPEFGHDFHAGGKDSWLYGVALKYAEIKGLELLGEIFGSADNSFRRHEIVTNIGLRLDISNYSSLLASIGKGIHHAGDQPMLLSYLGIQFRL
ncbi:MAG TPA: hypothetical protein VK452_08610 [Dissulfurispiraceae bacterium]|nr:hypothetical protein [Dissulfurispiraceae bacterium]